MYTIFSGAVTVVLGFLFFLIPILGEIVGPIFIFLGFLGIIVGVTKVIIGLLTPEQEPQRVIVQENIIEKKTTAEPSMADELHKISQLYEKGHITEDEFNASKKSIMQIN